MCGIVGLFLKDPKLEADLGAMLAGMIAPLSERGPDSTGFAVYGAETPGHSKLTLRAPCDHDFELLLRRLRDAVGAPFSSRVYGTHIVISVSSDRVSLARRALTDFHDAALVGSGKRMAIFKEVGRPADVSRRFDLANMSGTHAIGHTRMATESAVTTNGAHPFTTGDDQCLVHNGSLSNHNAVRRELIKHGLWFQTDNDSEVAAGFITAQLHAGRSLEKALEACIDRLDGFYTFVVGTETGFGVLRDPIACKPAVIAETEQFVAFGTEYRTLVDLPGIDAAKVWEPAPARVYQWKLH